ncbi:MAG: hypothetical protein JXA78_00135 [Anaerolineales bacterium]|nr:hypothetical protein [Anaerolineales bacterium]
MNLRRLNLETTLFALALLLALGLRFYQLGAAPLTDIEAHWALQAWQAAHPGAGQPPLEIGQQPAYVFLTAATCALFTASNFAARFWPALAGSLLVLLPLCFRRELGRVAALILAFGLALDPGLATVSRQAGGPMLALAFGLLAFGLWRAARPLPAGALAGLALLSGPTVIHGALSMGLAWAVYRLSFKPGAGRPAQAWLEELETPAEISEPATTASSPRLALASAAVVILLVGSGFFLHLQGLAAWFSSLLVYLDGWRLPSSVHALQPVVALMFYQPFALIFAMLGMLRWLVGQSLGREARSYPLVFPLVWAIVSLVLLLLYPARQVADLVWTLAPLWALAAFELQNYSPRHPLSPVSLLQAGMVLVLVTLFWNTLIASGGMAPLIGLPWASVRAAVLLGILALAVLTSALVALGWSWEYSRDGTVWGLSLAFIVYLLAALWGAAILRPNQPHELWGQSPASGQAVLLADTLEDLSNWSTGLPRKMAVVSTVDAPSLRWLLRDYPNTRFEAALSVEELPEVLITRQDAEAPTLTAAYRGQDFVWWVYPGWQGLLPPDFINWLAFRQAPLVNERLILWARADIFPGGVIEPSVEMELPFDVEQTE